MVETQKKVEELKKTYLSWSLHDSDVRREGKREGIQEGIRQGTEKTKLETARNMLLKNVGTIDQIAEITGLPEEKIKKLAEKLKAEA